MRPPFVSQPLAWLLISLASAQHIVEELSFGHKSNPSPNPQGLPGWSISSANHHPQILSDRVILTPPVPGNARGALWTDTTVSSETWSAEVEFRASGQDTGSGNLQFWFVKDKAAVNVDSVYTVGNFDGLALVLDQYGGRGGSLRGFLNDGSQNFKGLHDLESLAFGHCDYSYRNLGRPSKLRVATENGLRVSIDDKECFSSDRISLPSGYYFGITAATADQPDSFEINKFVVTSGIPHQHENIVKGGAPPRAAQPSQPGGGLQKLNRFPGAPEAVPDAMAEDIRGQPDQFADLHNRLQGLTHQIANIFGEFDALSKKLDERHGQVMGGVQNNDKIDALSRRLESIERNVEQVKRDVEGKDYKDHLDRLNSAIENVRGGLADQLPDNIGKCKLSSDPQIEYGG